MENLIVSLLKANNWKVSFAESCTGGAVAARLVNVPGASEVFEEGYITYSNAVKHKNLGVSQQVLDTVGAVSEACAREMARGCGRVSGADFCLSVTGLAGPGGGTEVTPVGTVFVGCCFHEKVLVKEFHFDGDRSEIRKLTVSHALSFLLECIRSESSASD